MDPDTISHEVISTCTAIEKLLTEAKEKSKDLSSFVETQLGPSFGPAIGIYANLFKALAVKDRTEFERKMKLNIRHSSVEESFDNLLSLESSWNKFLTAVDAELHGPAITAAATEGEKIKADIHLTNARTGEETSLPSLLNQSGHDYVHLVLLRHFA